MKSASIPAPAVTGQTTPFKNETTVVPTPYGPPQTAPAKATEIPADYPSPAQIIPQGHGIIYIPAPAKSSDPAPEGHGAVIVPA